jgi:NTP pyrophosphatase (non-canonical NTP hydrolase)
VDLVKKWIFHEHPIDEEHLKKELGDICWYIALICFCFGWDLQEILDLNIRKLEKRYPEGFDVDQSKVRKEGDI